MSHRADSARSLVPEEEEREQGRVVDEENVVLPTAVRDGAGVGQVGVEGETAPGDVEGRISPAGGRIAVTPPPEVDARLF